MQKCVSWLWHLAKARLETLAGQIGGLADVPNRKGEAKQMSASGKGPRIEKAHCMLLS